MSELIPAIFCAVAFIAFLFFLGYWGIKSDRMEKAQNGAENNADTPELLDDAAIEAMTENIHVVVVDQQCAVKVVGIKNQRTVEEFCVFFRTDDGEVFRLPVLKEVYDGFEIGQSGILTLVDGELFGFEPDDCQERERC